MEAILILGLIALLIIVVSGNNRLRSQLTELGSELSMLRRQVDRLLVKPETQTDKQAEQPVKPHESRWAPKPQVFEDPPIPKPEPKPQPPFPIPVVSPTPPPKPKRPGFFERNPDLEKFIGENLISKIGIAILVIAIGFFVKYAIDRNWIGPAGRVGIGVLCGGILIGLAHRLQKNYKSFSSILVGGGLAVFYFSIALAYKDYGLFSQTVAFIIMVVITVFAILLSLLYDRQELAIIALAGGFAVPFLVSNGSGNYIVLFTYLLLLNTGLLVMAYRKAWRLLNFIAFTATVLLYGGWLGTLPDNTPHSTFIGGFFFATAFYLLFLAINLAHNIRERKKFIASDFGILLADNALYFSAGLYLLYAASADAYKGLFSVALGVLNLMLVFALVRRRNIDPIILYLLVGVTLTFVSLTAPLQLHGHFITLFWAAESVVLLWLLQQSGIRILQGGFALVWICSFISLFMDWNNVYGPIPVSGKFLPVLFNKGFVTTLFVAAANGVLFRLLRRDGKAILFPEIAANHKSIALGTIVLALLYCSGAFEIAYQFNTRFAEVPGLSLLYLQLFTGLFILALQMLSKRGILSLPLTAQLLLPAAFLLFYIANAAPTYQVQERMLSSGHYGLHFVAHWLAAPLTAVVFYQYLSMLRTMNSTAELRTPISWIASAFAILFVSVEVHLLCNAIICGPRHPMEEISRNYVRVGLPIVWGLCSFALMWLGMRHKYRPLRIVSLSLFSITLLKLFLFDIRSVGVAGKIAAFFSLGVLLLVVSFMYQRLKRLIIEDERKQNAD